MTFDLVPNHPPQGLNLWEEEVEEEIIESESDVMEVLEESKQDQTSFALPLMARSEDVDMNARSEDSDADEGGLFGEDDDASDAENKDTRSQAQRTLIEDEEYD